jgi:hypothetical protein
MLECVKDHLLWIPVGVRKTINPLRQPLHLYRKLGQRLVLCHARSPFMGYRAGPVVGRPRAEPHASRSAQNPSTKTTNGTYMRGCGGGRSAAEEVRVARGLD